MTLHTLDGLHLQAQAQRNEFEKQAALERQLRQACTPFFRAAGSPAP